MTDVRKWLNDRSINPDVALAAGVRYDPNRNALLFPRVGMNHMPLGWKLRGLSHKWFANTPEGISNAECEPFVALDGSTTLCICEGELDALALASWIDWFPELEDAKVVGLPGANTFQNEYAGMYGSFDKVYLFPDPDVGGERLIQKVCGLMARTKVVKLEKFTDEETGEKSGDLNDHVQYNMGALIDAVADARAVPVQQRLRRTNYDFQRTHDIPNHILLDEALKYTRLKRVGKEYRGVCPLHEGDTDPSFMIDPKKGVFYCHGCKEGGDIIQFIKLNDGVGFGEAKKRALSLQ